MEDCGIDSAMDSDLHLMMMDSVVNSGSDLPWRILGLIFYGGFWRSFCYGF